MRYGDFWNKPCDRQQHIVYKHMAWPDDKRSWIVTVALGYRLTILHKLVVCTSFEFFFMLFTGGFLHVDSLTLVTVTHDNPGHRYAFCMTLYGVV